jgi:3-dehydroquinate dehydratase-2
MAKVLVIQGSGMNMRGKSQVEIFGPTTLDEMNEQIEAYAEGLGLEVEIFHSNIEGEVVNALYDAHERGFDAALINPAGYTTGAGPLRGAIAQVNYPVIEVHASNPTARGTVSNVLPVCKGSVYGFGVFGYRLALEAVKNMS